MVVCVMVCMLCRATSGFIEYWSPDDYKAPPSSGPAAVVKFTMKLDTDLFALAKAKTYARSLEVGEPLLRFGLWMGGRVLISSPGEVKFQALQLL